MRIKFFKHDGVQLPTELWFKADGCPVRYECDRSYPYAVTYYFYGFEKIPIENIVEAANKVFCKDPLKYGNPRLQVCSIEEIQTDEADRAVKVTFKWTE